MGTAAIVLQIALAFGQPQVAQPPTPPHRVDSRARRGRRDEPAGAWRQKAGYTPGDYVIAFVSREVSIPTGG